MSCWIWVMRNHKGSASKHTHIRRGRSLCRSVVGTWMWGCCTRTPHSQNHPVHIPLDIAENSIFPSQDRSHLKELREVSGSWPEQSIKQQRRDMQWG